MNDYRDLPERVAAAIADLVDAERSASPQARCAQCGHIETLRVDDAELRLLQAIRAEYVPRIEAAA